MFTGAYIFFPLKGEVLKLCFEDCLVPFSVGLCGKGVKP